MSTRLLSTLTTLTTRTLLTVALAGFTAPSAASQTGPFQDGELLIRNPNGSSPKLIRVEPSTGQAAVLIEPGGWGGWADSMVYDPHRGGVVACISLPPDPFTGYRLWVIDSDGSAVAIPALFGVVVHSLEPTVDGRLYFQRSGFGNTTLEYLDAANQLHVLMDETGLAPAAVEVEHLVYDPVGNVLIGSASSGWSSGSCGDPTMNTIWRIPLSADGSQLSGPVTCTPLAASSLNSMSLSRLPNGRILATYAGTNPFGFTIHEKMWSIDPATLGAVLWAESDLADINAGVYSTRLDRAVLFYDTTNELRTYAQGQGGGGTPLPVSLPIGDGTTGFSPADNMVQLDVLGPGCIGYTANHGVGLAGTGGLVPTFGAVGCPDIGETWSLSIGQVVGGAPGVIFVGLGVTALPFKGGTFYIDTLLLTLGIAVGGTPGVAGAGSLNLPVLITDPNLAGIEFVLQTGFQDAAGPSNASLSNALRFKAF